MGDAEVGRRDGAAGCRLIITCAANKQEAPWGTRRSTTEAAPEAYAEIYAGRRRAGRSTATVDLMIAAIARSQGARVVTRNVGDFLVCGVNLVNPWDL